MRRATCQSCLGIAILTLLLVLGACDRRTDDPVRPDFTDPNWTGSFEHTLSINVVGTKTAAVLTSKTDPGTTTLILSGGAVMTGNTQYDDIQEKWITTFGSYGGYQNSTVQYDLTINDLLYSGTIEMPSSISAAFQAFNSNSDYIFSWVSSVNPRFFIYTMDYAYNNQMYQIRKQLDRGLRSYTLQRKEWNENAITLLGMNIIAINYNTKAKNLVVYAMTSDSYQ